MTSVPQPEEADAVAADRAAEPTVQDVAEWWATGITRIAPGVIEHRGVPVQSLIGTVSFPEMIWLMVRGDRPSPAQARLLEAALVASTDHGPQAPSIAIARMAATCGVGLNNAVASGVNVLGDVHGGAGQQSLEMLQSCIALADDGLSWVDAGRRTVDGFPLPQGVRPGLWAPLPPA